MKNTSISRHSKMLQNLYTGLRTEKRRLWNRDLPFDELLFDRAERAQSLGFGQGASIYQNSYVFGNVKVGKNTWIGPFTILDGSGGLTIGSFCSISAGVLIYSHDSVDWALSGGKASYTHASVSIGNCCYIGSHTVIAKGVRIGDHAIVGASSFVNKDVPPFTIVAGTPCRRIGRIRLNKKGTPKLIFDR